MKKRDLKKWEQDIYLTHISKFDIENINKYRYVFFYCGDVVNCPPNANYLIGLLTECNADKYKLDWFMGKEVNKTDEYIELNVIGKMEVINNNGSNINIKLFKTNDNMNDFKQMSISDLKWYLKEYSSDYNFVKVLKENPIGYYDIHRNIVERDYAKIIFRAQKSEYCF